LLAEVGAEEYHGEPDPDWCQPRMVWISGLAASPEMGMFASASHV